MPEFQPYLDTIARHYDQWWRLYTLTDAEWKEERSAAPFFDFGLMVQTIAPKDSPELGDRPQPKIERLPVTEGLQKYAIDHVLLVGRPGSGKSTALARLMLDLVKDLQIPVLVELRSYQSSILELIRSSFKRHDLNLTIAQIEILLDDRKLILLIDGVNELPSEPARTDLLNFRRNHSKVSMIFTTRDLSLGGNLGIEKQLEMQPLTEMQMRSFINAYLPGNADVMLGQLKDRLREFGTTPLLLWMLCEVFNQTPNQQLPNNLGGIFQIFTGMYEVSSIRKHEVAVLKGDVRPLSDRRLWKPALKHLASVMMQGKQPIDFRVVLTRSEAEEALLEVFQNESFPVRDLLDDLLKYHLLQNKAPDIIEFRHQLIQEYYAAEWLLDRTGQLDDETLECDYLNYLKWTEPLALVDDEALAVRVVERSFAVDLMLGARLAGEVRHQHQSKTVKLIDQIITKNQILDYLKIKVLGKTRSEFAIDKLIKLKDSSFGCPHIDALIKIKSTKVVDHFIEIFDLDGISLCYFTTSRDQYLEDNINQDIIKKLAHKLESDSSRVRERSAAILKRTSPDTLCAEALLLSKHRNPEIRVEVLKLLDCCDARICKHIIFNGLEDSEVDVQIASIFALNILDNQESSDKILLKILNHSQNGDLKLAAAGVLGMKGRVEALPILLEALNYSCSDRKKFAIKVLGDLHHDSSVSRIILFLEFEEFRDETQQALLKFGESFSSQILIDYWDDLSSESQDALLYVLMLIRDESALMKILLESTRGNYEIRLRAISYLGNFNNQKAHERLLELLIDQDYNVCEHAWSGINKLENSEIFHKILNTNEIDSKWKLHAKFKLSGMTVEDLIKVSENASDALFSSTSNSDVADQLFQEFMYKSSYKSSEEAKSLRQIARQLGKIKNDCAAHILPDLITLLPTKSSGQALSAIQGIQANCKFYNYETHQKALQRKLIAAARDTPETQLDKIEQGVNQTNQRLNQMAEQPTTISISGGTFNGPVNLASNQGTQPTTIIDTQNNNYFSSDETLKHQIAELQQLITELETQHPNLQTEAQATQIVQQTMDQIQTQNPDRWQKLRDQMTILKQQFFNPDRHTQALKATIVEVTKTKWEENLLVKAIVTYLDKFSETPNKGA